jgi:hypothetical protein
LGVKCGIDKRDKNNQQKQKELRLTKGIGHPLGATIARHFGDVLATVKDEPSAAAKGGRP